SLVNEIVGQFNYQAKDKDLQFDVTVNDGTEITSDRELIAMILQNLIGNAIKYSRKGEVQIACDPAGGDHKACRLSVIDQGPGIEPAALAKMFQPFARGETNGQAGT